jgi:hypothetical protein
MTFNDVTDASMQCKISTYHLYSKIEFMILGSVKLKVKFPCA